MVGLSDVRGGITCSPITKSLYDFWGQIQGASGDIRALCSDLKVLLEVINDIRQNEEIFGSHETTAIALEGWKNIFFIDLTVFVEGQLHVCQC
jgi:hypothetical protein